VTQGASVVLAGLVTMSERDDLIESLDRHRGFLL
jgi:hypothetical protein